MTTETSSPTSDLPPHDLERIVNAPFPERVRLACQNWADSSPNRPSLMALYWGKYFFVLIGVWAFWCSFNAGYPGFSAVSDWAFTNEAFKKAMVWSICLTLRARRRPWADPWQGGGARLLLGDDGERGEQRVALLGVACWASSLLQRAPAHG